MHAYCDYTETILLYLLAINYTHCGCDLVKLTYTISVYIVMLLHCTTFFTEISITMLALAALLFTVGVYTM